MSPKETLEKAYGGLWATSILTALRSAGWIVVREDAIRLAQAMAREEERDMARAA
jgi:hypothetical protein